MKTIIIIYLSLFMSLSQARLIGPVSLQGPVIAYDKDSVTIATMPFKLLKPKEYNAIIANKKSHFKVSRKYVKAGDKVKRYNHITLKIPVEDFNKLMERDLKKK